MAPPGQTFLMRPTSGPPRFRASASIGVQGRELVVTDHLARPHRFPLSGPDGPKILRRYQKIRSRGTTSGWWAILDSKRRALVTTSSDLWDPEDFHRLATAAHLVIGATALDDPTGERPDVVDLDTSESRWWNVVFLLVVAPLLVLVSLGAVFTGSYWPWVATWSFLGLVHLQGVVRDSVVAARNRARLSPTGAGEVEAPSVLAASLQAIREEHAWRMLALYGAVAVAPIVVRAVVT